MLDDERCEGVRGGQGVHVVCAADSEDGGVRDHLLQAVAGASVLVLLLGQMVVGELQWRSHLTHWWLILIHVALATAIFGAMSLLAARLVGRARARTSTL